MPVVSARTFERWLRGLDAERLRGFVSDLYAESGREVRRRADGALVVGDAGRVVATVHARRRLRTPQVPDDADVVVVASSPSRRLVRRAAETGSALVGPSDLRNLALYGVDRDDCERLFRRYFDASPSVERSDATGRDGAAGDADEASLSRRPLARVAAEPLSSLVVLALVGLVVAALFGPFGPGVAPDTDDAAGSAGPVAVGAPADATAADGGLFPPGIGPTGVVSSEALAAAHADAAAGRSYELEVRHSNTERWDVAYQRAEVAAPTRYRYSVTGYRATDGSDADIVQYSSYADGRNNYVHTEHGGRPWYVRHAVRTDEDGHGPFENRAARAVERYLNATRTSVTRENWSVQPYRVVATGAPASVADDGNVTDYRAEAHVGADGFVSHLSVSYEVRTDEGTKSVSFWMQYTNIDPRRVRAPPWYDEARNATTDAPRATDTTPSAPATEATATAGEESDRNGTETTRARDGTPQNATETA